MGGAVERAGVEGVLVALDHLLEAVNSWVEDVTIQGEAVGCALSVRGYGTTKTIERDLLVSVVVLQDITHVSDGLEILVPGRVEVVKRRGVVGRTVGKREVDRDC